MAKRRTRKQKKGARHQFTLSWEPAKDEPKTNTSEANVKGQNKKSEAKKKSVRNVKNYSYSSAKSENLGTIKKDIIKSLILAGIIVASEIVIYLFLY